MSEEYVVLDTSKDFSEAEVAFETDDECPKNQLMLSITIILYVKHYIRL